MGADRTRTLRGAVAGAVAAGIWAGQQPLDKRAFGVDYDDTALLGTLITRDRRDSRTLPIGVAIHLLNGAAFGAAYSVIAPSLPGPRIGRGIVLAVAEGLATWPLARFAHLHPASSDLPPLWGNHRALGQTVWRHALFGAVLGELERRLNPDPVEPAPAGVEQAATNGHGDASYVAVVTSQ